MDTQTPIILLILLILSKHIPSPPVLGQIKSTCPMLRLFKSAFSGISFNLLFLLFFVAKNSLELWGRAPPKSLPFGNQQPVRRSAAPAGHVFSPCRVDFAAQHLQPPCTSITAQCDMRFCNYLSHHHAASFWQSPTCREGRNVVSYTPVDKRAFVNWPFVNGTKGELK